MLILLLRRYRSRLAEFGVVVGLRFRRGGCRSTCSDVRCTRFGTAFGKLREAYGCGVSRRVLLCSKVATVAYLPSDTAQYYDDPLVLTSVLLVSIFSLLICGRRRCQLSQARRIRSYISI